METLTLIGTIVGIATFAVLVGGGFFWWGRLSFKVDHLASDVQAIQGDVLTLRDDMQTLRDDVQALKNDVQTLQTDMQAVRDDIQAARGDVQALRDEVKAGQDALLGEIRRSEQRILAALANHSHVAPDAGQPVFRFPPGMEAPEPAAADGAPAEA